MVSLDQAKSIADIFQALAIGMGALLGGAGALKVLDERRSKRDFKRAVKKWTSRYPKEGLGKDFQLIRHSYSKDPDSHVIGSSSHIYVADERDRARHWIANPRTLEVLGYNQDEVQGVAKKKLESYSIAEQIDLDRGSYI